MSDSEGLEPQMDAKVREVLVSLRLTGPQPTEADLISAVSGVPVGEAIKEEGWVIGSRHVSLVGLVPARHLVLGTNQPGWYDGVMNKRHTVVIVSVVQTKGLYVSVSSWRFFASRQGWNEQLDLQPNRSSHELAPHLELLRRLDLAGQVFGAHEAIDLLMIPEIPPWLIEPEMTPELTRQAWDLQL